MTVTEYDEILFDKIGGWLVLPAFIHPLLSILGNLKSSYDLFALYSEKLPVEYQVFFVVTGFISIALAVAWFFSTYLAASLNFIFPKFYIWLIVSDITIGLVALSVAYYYFNVPPAVEDSTAVIKSIIAACIWIPYMLVSKRVKATFYGVPMPRNTTFENVSSPLKHVAASRQEERRMQPMSDGRVNLNMVQRVGMVFYWAGMGVGAILLAAGSFALFNAPDRFFAIVMLIAAVLSWLVGRALKYILVGR